jgi:hypothetical protein
MGGSIISGERISKSLVRPLGNIEREVCKGKTRDLRRVPSSKVNGQRGVGGGRRRGSGSSQGAEVNRGGKQSGGSLVSDSERKNYCDYPSR